MVRSVSSTQNVHEDVTDDEMQDACCSNIMVQRNLNVITKKQENGQISAGMD